MPTTQAQALDALLRLYVSACDTRAGYRDGDLHEPWAVTQERTRKILIDNGLVDADDLVY